MLSARCDVECRVASGSHRSQHPRVQAKPSNAEQPADSAVAKQVVLPARPQRVDALCQLLGEPAPEVAHLARGIRSSARRHFVAHVEPLIGATWPAMRSEPFYDKLRIGACDLYASAPYMALFCAPNRPPLVRLVTDIAARLPLPTPALALLGRGSMELFGRFAYPHEHRRIALIAAFIVVVDHVFDHTLQEPAEIRGDTLLAVIDGRALPRSAELSLVRALTVAMGEQLEADERAAFEAAMARVRAWIAAEVRALLGQPDPAGLGHRLAGVEGTIDGLLFPVARFAGERTRSWMYEVSMFVQVMDDYLDFEQDLACGRPTPVTDGRWTFTDVERTWHSTLSGLAELLASSGLGSPRYVRFVQDAYVLMMAEVMQAMATRPTA